MRDDVVWYVFIMLVIGATLLLFSSRRSQAMGHAGIFLMLFSCVAFFAVYLGAALGWVHP